jgi:dihydroorotate dehydrogenase electron transfer subunit
MARFTEPTIRDQRVFGDLHWLVLHEPTVAASARPGHYLLLRCAPPGSADPLLRRTFFIARADRSEGTVTLLFTPDEPGLHWLAALRNGSPLDSFGPLGTPFSLEATTRNLLLAGMGPGLAALIFAAYEADAHGAAVVLHAAAPNPELLPPPFLLPADVEYQELQSPISNLQSPVAWADQLFTALPQPLLPPLIEQVRATKLRWQQGFAQNLLAGPMPCGTGVCQACLVETRDSLRTRCKDGPIFDLRALRNQ